MSKSNGMLELYLGSVEKGSPILHVEFDEESSRFGAVKEAAINERPGFLAIRGDRLYSVQEVQDYKGEQTGSLACYRILGDKTLELLGDASSGGQGPCHVSISADGGFAFAANYVGGTVSTLALADGAPVKLVNSARHSGKSIHEKRQDAPHPHCARPSPDGQHLLVPDLGTDHVYVYRIDGDAQHLQLKDQWQSTPGSGPRHISFHPNGKVAALARELDSHVTLLDWDADEVRLTAIESHPTLPGEFDEHNLVSEVAFSSDGKHLYVANRGHNSLAVFSLSSSGRNATFVTHVSAGGDWPRHFALSPDGRHVFVANAQSHDVAAFRRDSQTGQLQQTDILRNLKSPSCVAFL